MKKISITLALIALALTTIAQVKLPNIFTDHMVLQRNMPINIWGWANAGEKVIVSFAGQTKQAIADKAGNWKVVLSPRKEGGPYEMKIKGSNEIVLKDILMGEVWVCSGQSNMEFEVSGIANPQQEAATANYPNIRQLKVAHITAIKPQADIPETAWTVCNPQTVYGFTAAGYFFAKKLYNELKVPIGIINSSWGGTNIETWISDSSIKTHPYFNTILNKEDNNIEKQMSIRVADLKTKIIKLQGDLNVSDIDSWLQKDYNDSKWPTLNVPQFWEEQGLQGLDAVAWYRKTIELTEEQASKAETIMLSKIDDMDQTYINGVKIGGMNDYAAVRKYAIPKNLLKAGSNTIAIRVFDGSGGGGIYGNKEDVKIMFNGLPELNLAGAWKFRIDGSSLTAGALKPNSYPSLLFNSMIHPLINYAIRGVIWYQGEANTWRSKQYKELFPLLIRDWRSQWKQKDLGFYFVQLASFDASNGKANGTTGSMWAELRDAQKSALALPYTGMAVASDIGNAKDIHPKNKQDVGLRLALNALKMTYKKNIVPAGPLYQSVKFVNGKAMISFTNVGNGLTMRGNDKELKGFQIAGADKIFHWANAKIVGNKVEVYSNEVKSPVAVRYGWTDVLDDINLYNKNGLPASPFRTDDWLWLTEKNGYKIFE